MGEVLRKFSKNQVMEINLGPPQVKFRLLISSISYVMNFRDFSEMP